MLTSLTMDEIKKKIHGVRAQFLAELNKIKKSEVSGASIDGIYVPKLWCFELLQFLQHGRNVVSKGDSNLKPALFDEQEPKDSQALSSIMTTDDTENEVSQKHCR